MACIDEMSSQEKFNFFLMLNSYLGFVERPVQEKNPLL